MSVKRIHEPIDIAVAHAGSRRVVHQHPVIGLGHLGEAAQAEAIKLADRLRKQGTGVTISLGQKSLKAQLRQANNLGVRYALIIGDEEVKACSVILRDMATSQQESVPLSRIGEKANLSSSS